MARRRRLELPTDETLERIRAAAAAEPEGRPGVSVLAPPPPIAQVAADGMAAQRREIDALRADAARGRADAARLAEAEERGLIVAEVPLDAIDVDYLTRDRLSAHVEDDGWRALKASIQAHGQRTPIELAPLAHGPAPYGLISGWRRLSALRRLHEETGDPRWLCVRALVRTPATLAQAFVGMVEENEVREGLSYFERGRICLRAAEQGAFPTAEAALEALFATGSPAKRSKIRSFILLVEELGDLLVHPQTLGERLGLRLALALKAGQGAALRRLLGAPGGRPPGPQEEQAQLALALDRLRRGDVAPRADRAAGPAGVRRISLATGGVLKAVLTSDGAVIRVLGSRVDADGLNRALAALAVALDGATDR